jgi:molybdopterin-guanine dinucleotide biosynthesis protein A
MAGLCAALYHASKSGHDLVLCAPCDLIGLPADSAVRLAPAPAVAADQWLVGLWPANLANRLSSALESGAISARRWASIAGASHRPFPPVRNINRPADMA